MAAESDKSKITIIIDSREQLPYAFASERIATIRRSIPNGDYSLDGQDYDLAVERKSLEDYCSTVIRDRDRFRRELVALGDYRDACIVVEATMMDIANHVYQSGAHPNAVFGATTSIIVDYGIPVYFAGTRQMARQFTEEWLLRWALRLEREEKRIAGAA